MNNIHDENKIYCKEKKENKNFDSGARYMPFLPCFILSTDTDTVVTDALFQRILVMLLGDHVPHWIGNGISFFFLSKRLNAKKESMPKQSSTNLLGQMSGYKNTIIGLHPITVLGHPQWATPESRNWPTTKCFASYLSLLPLHPPRLPPRRR